MLSMQRRRGGEDGIYHCVIPVTGSIYHTVYIGVYTASTGKSVILLKIKTIWFALIF